MKAKIIERIENMNNRGGCALVYNEDIARALCTPSELKRSDFGRLPPNSSEDWIDVQTRALSQAWSMIRRAMRYMR
jgi:hypothetical protein